MLFHIATSASLAIKLKSHLQAMIGCLLIAYITISLKRSRMSHRLDLMRRVAIPFVALALKSVQAKITLLAIINYVILMNLGKLIKHKSALDRKLACLTEVIHQLIIYFAICFTDFVHATNAKLAVGTALEAYIFIAIGYHTTYLIW